MAKVQAVQDRTAGYDEGMLALSHSTGSLREALYTNVNMPINLLAIPEDHEHWNEGDATDSRSRPEMRFHAFHGQGFRQILHHDD